MNEGSKKRFISARDVAFLTVPLALAIISGMAALYGRAAGFSTGPETGDFDVLTAGLFTLALLALLFYGLKRHPEKAARVIVAGVTVAGTISGLVLLKVWLQASRTTPILFLAALPLGYLGLNWSFRGYFGNLSQRKTNILMIGSATLLGSLMGTAFPTLYSMVFLIMLTVVDVFVVETNILTSVVGKISYEKMVSVATLPMEEYLVGLGDFLAYAILVTASLKILGVYGAVEAGILVLIGALATFEITRRRTRAPGLLIPIGLGLLPMILGPFFT
ncbi:hypothetical protein E6H34_03955 [Candidatus Bathyarchaeota archaeon]|nr:MAG: hypothetical protein E6H34_03955 [Candidatus Bathyarchaeota archaeon]